MKKKRQFKKAVLVAIILFFCLIALTSNVEAASYSRETIKERLNTLRNTPRFPCWRSFKISGRRISFRQL